MLLVCGGSVVWLCCVACVRKRMLCFISSQGTVDTEAATEGVEEGEESDDRVWTATTSHTAKSRRYGGGEGEEEGLGAVAEA